MIGTASSCPMRPRDSFRVTPLSKLNIHWHPHDEFSEMRQHTSAHVSIRQHTPAYVSIRQHMSGILCDAAAPSQIESKPDVS